MKLEMRDYQNECLDIINSLDSGSYLVVMATGLGKTATFSRIKREGRVLIISHREELVHQPEKYYDCSFGVERAQETSHGEEVISASVQTLVNRLNKFSPDEFDILITDEAHHAIADSYQKIYKYFKPRLHLGFTATPNRGDNLKLGQVYSKVIFERNIKWGIKNGYLSDIKCLRADIGYDLKNVGTRNGDYQIDTLGKAVDLENYNNLVAKIYEDMAVGPTLIFAVSVSHANHIAAKIPGAAVITGKTKDRGAILEDFRNGKIKVIVNCMVLTEGTDLPMIETIIMCRPTQNVTLYTQAVGRGLRLYKGKKELLLIDCVGVSSLPICTAPVLMGLDPKKAPKVFEQGKGPQVDHIMLSEMDDIAAKVNMLDEFSDAQAWKVNARLVKLFEENGNYDTHGVNYTVHINGDMICSIGNGFVLTVTAEDMTGNSSLYIRRHEKLLYIKSNLPTQKALDLAHSTLSSSYEQNKKLWDMQECKQWGSAPASDKQKKFIRSLYKNNVKTLKAINMKDLTKYQASCLINRKLETGRK